MKDFEQTLSIEDKQVDKKVQVWMLNIVHFQGNEDQNHNVVPFQLHEDGYSKKDNSKC